jgi:osmoprotectant transport system substrate-binding protein
MSRRAGWVLGLPAVCAILWAACGGAAVEPDKDAIGDQAVTVGSFDFAESVILAEVYAGALEGNGYQIERALAVGPRELVEPALEKGLIDFVPEYLGTSVEFLNEGAGEATSDVATTYRALTRELGLRSLAALDPARAQDTNGIAVTGETSAKYGLHTISDLVSVSGELVFGGPPECPERPLCLQGLERAYGLRFERFAALDASGPVTAGALEAGEVDVALLFSTSGYLAEKSFVLLEDDRALQPAENVVPVVRAEVLRKHGQRFRQVVDSVSRLLTTPDLIELNRLVSLEGREPRAVAQEWLRSHGFHPVTEGRPG